MKIVHSSGKAYQLAPDTQIEIERPNLFFNDYGEQSLPVDLPDTNLNRELTGYPDMVANRKKPQTDITCSIRDGDYCVTARQAILGAKRKEKITTTFYMNEGSFLSRIEKVAVPAVFGSETVPEVETVEQGINWCRSLLDNTNPHFTLFPVIIELDGEKRGAERHLRNGREWKADAGPSQSHKETRLIQLICPYREGGQPYNHT